MSENNGGKIAVTIKYLVSLADKTGRRSDTVKLSRGSVLADLTDWLERERDLRVPDKRIMTVLNGKGWDQYPEKLNTELTDGDTVLLFPPISGG